MSSLVPLNLKPITAPGDLGSSVGITAYANARTTAADNYILKLGELARDLQAPSITPEFPTMDTPPPISVPAVPDFQTVVWTAPGLPAPFEGSLTIDDIMPEPFDTNPPEMIFPDAPASFSDSLPDAPGVDFSFDMPTLSVDIAPPPALLSLNISKFEGLNLPSLDSDLPVLTAVAPSVIAYTPGAGYTSSLLTAMKDHLQDAIMNGGTGLSAAVENAIWDRAREREARNQQDALDGLEKMEGLGFSLPPGVYVDARIKVLTETNYTKVGLSREIAIKQAELEQENVKTALTVAVQLEGQLINYTNSVEQRMFESCKYATEAGIAVYNAKVAGYTAFVDAYKTKVAIYEAQIRGELARVDAYKALISAEQAKADINKSLVEEYRVLSEVALSRVEIFKAEVSAIQAKASIEKSKIEIYGEQIKGYTAKVNAFTAGVEAFRARITAEGTKQEAYKSQVQAYTARVEAVAKTAEVRIEEFKARVASKSAELDGYKAAVMAEGERVKGIATLNSAVADSYKAQVSGASAFNETITKQWQVSYDQAQKTAEIAINAAKMNAELFMTTRSIATDSAKVGAQVSAQLGASALGAIHWSQSFSYGQSNSFSDSTSFSQSSSYSRNDNYNYSV